MVILAAPVRGQSAVRYQDAPLRDVLTGIEAELPFRFLYRDAVIAGVQIDLETDVPGLIDALRVELDRYSLGLRVDEASGQVLLFRSESGPAPTRSAVSGMIVDRKDGSGLPFATVTWTVDGRLRGVASDQSGRFVLERSALGEDAEVTVRGSYLGYAGANARLDPRDLPGDLVLRLAPIPIESSEVVVTGVMLRTDVDSTFRNLLGPGRVAPLGESSILRAMQALPAVGISAALSNGISVRGSQSDGFQVLLDGMPIYSQSHLFGLFDSFNSDALQTVGFYYGIAPAAFQAPPGGTVSFLTRSGSRTRSTGILAASNASIRGTLEGPIADGRGSWLISARRSYIGALDWFGNDTIVAMGLNAGRETSDPVGLNPLQGRRPIVRSDLTARYFDAHGKLVWDWENGSRLTASLYAGGDSTRFDGERLAVSSSMPGGQLALQRLPAATSNRWGTEAGSVRFSAPVGARSLLETVLGVSTFDSRYLKEDFVFSRPASQMGPGNGQGGRDNSGGVTLGSFENQNTLSHFKASQEASIQAEGVGLVTTGVEWSFFDMQYAETSLERDRYGLDRQGSQIDAFIGVSTRSDGALGLDAGLRSHYYDLGSRMRLSPRLNVRAALGNRVTVSGGYSRNYQFLHRLSLEYESNADIWILNGADEKPAQVDYVTGGFVWKTGPGPVVQIEAYRKSFSNVRIHETTARRRALDVAGVLLNPWLTNASGTAEGLEFLVSHRLGPVSMTHAYTRSAIRYSHPAVNRGAEFPAYWERPNQYTLQAAWKVSKSVELSATWFAGSGTPNALSYADPEEPARNSAYHRMDASVRYARLAGTRPVEIGFSLYNAYNRNNVWYRTTVPIMMSAQQPGQPVTSTNVDVYDLGIQPSFEIRLGL